MWPTWTVQDTLPISRLVTWQISLSYFSLTQWQNIFPSWVARILHHPVFTAGKNLSVSGPFFSNSLAISLNWTHLKCCVVSLSCYNRCHKLVSLNDRDLFFTVLEAGSPTWRLWLLWSQGKLLFHISDGTDCFYMAEWERLSVSCEGTGSSLHPVTAQYYHIGG